MKEHALTVAKATSSIIRSVLKMTKSLRQRKPQHQRSLSRSVRKTLLPARRHRAAMQSRSHYFRLRSLPQPAGHQRKLFLIALLRRPNRIRRHQRCPSVMYQSSHLESPLLWPRRLLRHQVLQHRKLLAWWNLLQNLLPLKPRARTIQRRVLQRRRHLLRLRPSSRSGSLQLRRRARPLLRMLPQRRSRVVPPRL